jgi:hypothetical protein
VILRIQLNDPYAPSGRSDEVARPVEFGGFERHLTKSRAPWPSVLMSVAVHCALGAVIAGGAGELLFRDTRKPTVYRVELLPSVHVQLRSPLIVPRGLEGRADPAAPSREEIAAAIQQRSTVLRTFELPELPRTVQSDQTLLQPNTPPEITPNSSLRLPEFVYWSPEALKRPTPKKFVVPGKVATASPAAELTAVPNLAPPANDQLNAKYRLDPSTNPLAKLTLPPVPAAPLRAFRQPEAKATAAPSVEMLPGDPSAMVALNANPPQAKFVVEVPAGNMIGNLPPAAPPSPQDSLAVTGRAGLDRAGSIGGDAPARRDGAARSGSGSGPGIKVTGAIDVQVDGGTGGAGGGGGSGSGSGSGGSSGSGTGLGIGVGSAGSVKLSGAVPLRQVHPENGQYDIVVSHMSRPPELPEGSKLLRGSPIYTVYIRVNARQEWIMRFCTSSSSAGTRTSGHVVTLENPAPLTPPYPRISVVPQLEEVRDKIAVLHGFLTKEGRFRALQAVQAEDQPLMTHMEPFLAKWEFRPATRDGVPVEIEILLVFPRLKVQTAQELLNGSFTVAAR